MRLDGDTDKVPSSPPPLPAVESDDEGDTELPTPPFVSVFGRVKEAATSDQGTQADCQQIKDWQAELEALQAAARASGCKVKDLSPKTKKLLTCLRGKISRKKKTVDSRKADNLTKKVGATTKVHPAVNKTAKPTTAASQEKIRLDLDRVISALEARRRIRVQQRSLT